MPVKDFFEIVAGAFMDWLFSFLETIIPVLIPLMLLCTIIALGISL